MRREAIPVFVFRLVAHPCSTDARPAGSDISIYKVLINLVFLDHLGGSSWLREISRASKNPLLATTIVYPFERNSRADSGVKGRRPTFSQPVASRYACVTVRARAINFPSAVIVAGKGLIHEIRRLRTGECGRLFSLSFVA